MSLRKSVAVFLCFVFFKTVSVCLIFLSSYAESHISVSQAYHLSDIFTDLLNFSAHQLVVGGRLVYWLPVYRPELVYRLLVCLELWPYQTAYIRGKLKLVIYCFLKNPPMSF